MGNFKRAFDRVKERAKLIDKKDRVDDMFDEDYTQIENQLEKQRKLKEKQMNKVKPDFVQQILNARSKGKLLLTELLFHD